MDKNIFLIKESLSKIGLNLVPESPIRKNGDVHYVVGLDKLILTVNKGDYDSVFNFLEKSFKVRSIRTDHEICLYFREPDSVWDLVIDLRESVLEALHTQPINRDKFENCKLKAEKLLASPYREKLMVYQGEDQFSPLYLMVKGDYDQTMENLKSIE